MQWRKFENVINKEKLECNNSKININDHFANVGKMVEIGLNTKKETSDYNYQDMPENLPTPDKS